MRWHCKDGTRVFDPFLSSSFFLFFPIEYEDEMKKMSAAAGRRPLPFCFDCFSAPPPPFLWLLLLSIFFWSFQERNRCFEEIFSKYLQDRLFCTVSRSFYSFSSLEGPPSVQGSCLILSRHSPTPPSPRPPQQREKNSNEIYKE